MKANRLPSGWDESRVRRVREHYENQAEDEAVAEDEAAYNDRTHSLIGVPIELVPTVRQLIARQGLRVRSRAVRKTKSEPRVSKRKPATHRRTSTRARR